MEQLKKKRQELFRHDNLFLSKEEEFKGLMEKEKERRLKEIPKLRPSDQIDINEKQLQMIKDIFDSLPRIPQMKDTVGSLDFFSTIRRNPEIRAINTALAREPDGESRTA